MSGGGPGIGYATIQVIPSAKGFANLLQQQTNGPLGGAGKSSGAKFGGGLVAGATKFAAPLAAVFAGGMAVSFLKDAVNGASDLNEAGTALAQVFGSAVGKVTKFASGGAKALGMTTLAAEQAAQTFGVYGKAAGLAPAANAKFSDSLVSLSTDLASFYNTSPEDAMNAIASGLRGEAEPLRQYGVLLNSATLKQEAMKLGLIKTTKDALTPQQQVLAAQSVIMKQTAVAQGDFQRTSGGLANQQRILSAEWDNAKSSLGKALLPVVLAAVRALNGGLAPAVDLVLGVVQRLGPVFSAVVGVVKDFWQGFTVGTDSANSAQSAAAVFGAVLFEKVLPAVAQGKALLTSLGTAFQAIVTFATPLLPILQNIGAQILAAVGPGLQSVAATIQNQFIPAFVAILPILEPIAEFILKTLGSAVVGVITGAFNVINGVLKAISGLFQIFASLVRGDWEGLWNGVKLFVTGILQALIGAFEVWWNMGIINIFRKGAELLLTGVWKNLFNLLKGAAESGMASIRGLIEGAVNAVLGLFKNGASAYIGVWKGLFADLLAAVTNGWKVLHSAFGGALSALRTLASEACSAILGFFKAQFGLIESTVKGAIDGAAAAVKALPGAVKGAVGDAGSWLVSAGRDVISGFISGIRSMAGAVISAIRSTITDALPGYVKKALGIHSPSRVFAALGANVADGMALGITRGAPAVTRAASGLVDIVPNAGASAAGGLSSGGAREFHYHNHGGGSGMAENDFFSAAQRVPLLVGSW